MKSPRLRATLAVLATLALGAGLVSGTAGTADAKALKPATTFTMQPDGSSGKTGASAIADQTKNSVTRRVPNRSISTPIWIDRNTASSERPPTSMPSFPEKAVSNAQARDIYAYIKTFKLDAPDLNDLPAYARIQASAAKPYKPGQ